VWGNGNDNDEEFNYTFDANTWSLGSYDAHTGQSE
jgi:hypothetical protein